MRNNWKPKTITVRELEEKINKKEIAVPTYQRGVVWTETMRKDLIDSVKHGYPFGSLIMFNYEKPGEPLLLIDGLQRSTALFKFVNNPSEYFGEMDISDETIDKLSCVMGFENASESTKKDLRLKLVDWTKKLSGSDAIKNMDVYKCASYLAETVKMPGKNPNDWSFINEIQEVIAPTFNDYKDICNGIVDREVPYIEITGDPDCLSTIFFRINDKGIKLSKENIFAATWTNKSIKITNPNLFDFVKIVAERYDSIQSESTSIFGYSHQEFIDNKELDVFELCHAFGKYIKMEFPDLFGKERNKLKSEPIGFTLLNACLLGYKDTLKEMNQLLSKRFDTDEEINTFIIKVLSCIRYVDRLLAPYIKFKSNKRIGGKPLHTDFQIVSIIASVFRMKHVTEIAPKEYIFHLSSTAEEWDNYDNLLRRNLIKRYISDTVNNIWSGHGDNTLDNIIHDNNYDYYTREISSTDLRSTLYNWYVMYRNNNKELTEKDIKSPSSADKLLMNIVYASTFTAQMQLNEDKFDIEHIFPKKMAEHTLKRYGGRLKLSLSSIGNLCLLPESTNRKKKDKTIYDDIDYTNKLGKKITIKELEDNFTFTNQKQLSWVNDNTLSKDDLESKYNKFIDDRFDVIVSKIIGIIYSDNK